MTTPIADPVDGSPIPAVVGPTASGKTELAILLAEALDGEIVSVDSVQIYRHFDVGSGKPSVAERQRARHHLVDGIDPLAPVDAARFVALADEAIASIRRRGKRPILCGGTFLWTKALLYGLAPSPPADPVVRRRHQQLVAADGPAALHRRLGEVDPARASKLDPHDVVRVSRALEVYELSGRTQSAWHADHGFRTPRYRATLLGVERSRDEIEQRIAERVHRWLGAGWIDEVRRLVAAGYGDARAMGSVGYRQVRQHVEGALPRDELAAAIVRTTRTFARRQRTWLRDQPLRWWTPGAPLPVV